MSLRDKFTDNLRWHILDTYIKLEIFWGKYNLKQIPKENAAQREAKSPFLNQQSQWVHIRASNSMMAIEPNVLSRKNQVNTI